MSPAPALLLLVPPASPQEVPGSSVSVAIRLDVPNRQGLGIERQNAHGTLPSSHLPHHFPPRSANVDGVNSHNHVMRFAVWRVRSHAAGVDTHTYRSRCLNAVIVERQRAPSSVPRARFAGCNLPSTRTLRSGEELSPRQPLARVGGERVNRPAFVDAKNTAVRVFRVSIAPAEAGAAAAERWGRTPATRDARTAAAPVRAIRHGELSRLILLKSRPGPNRGDSPLSLSEVSSFKARPYC